MCDEFLASHSEYLDGVMPPLQAARMSAHAESCSACARYDRIVRKSAVLLQELPDIAPSPDFELRLQHRVFHIEDAAALSTRRSPAGLFTTLGVAATLAVLAWSPLFTFQTRDSAATAEASTEAPAYATLGAAPLIVESSWYPVALPELPAHQSPTLIAAFPGPYSPLVVTPPAHRSVRTVSTEFVPVD
jgi:anti-sigma factor RsiW